MAAPGIDPNAISVDPGASAVDASSLTGGKLGGELTGLDVGNHLPTGDAAKLAQKAHDDYLHGDVESDAITREGKINPIRHAINKFQEAGFEGGLQMAFFGTLFLGLSAAGTALMPGFLGALAGVITTGLVWYGSKAAMQAYQDANEHNQTVDKIKSGELSPELAITKENTLDTDLPEKGTAAVLGATTMMTANPSIVAAQADESKAARPEFLAKILENGPKGLSPKELAAQIEAERSNQELNI